MHRIDAIRPCIIPFDDDDDDDDLSDIFQRPVSEHRPTKRVPPIRDSISPRVADIITDGRIREKKRDGCRSFYFSSFFFPSLVLFGERVTLGEEFAEPGLSFIGSLLAD